MIQGNFENKVLLKYIYYVINAIHPGQNHPGRDTNPSKVCSQQMLVLIYLSCKEGKLN